MGTENFGEIRFADDAISDIKGILQRSGLAPDAAGKATARIELMSGVWGPDDQIVNLGQIKSELESLQSATDQARTAMSDLSRQTKSKLSKGIEKIAEHSLGGYAGSIVMELTRLIDMLSRASSTVLAEIGDTRGAPPKVGERFIAYFEPPRVFRRLFCVSHAALA